MTASALTNFLVCFADALEHDARPISQAHAAQLRRLAARLPPVREVQPSRVPIQTACEAELGSFGDEAPLARALVELLPAIHITRSASYLANPPSSDFGANYGYGIICGPDGGPPTLIQDAEVAFGLMFLGPRTHYPLHHHPADELYYTVTGPSFWRAGNADWVRRGIDEIIHHPSWLPHATLSAERPLVLLYIWEGDLNTDATFIADTATADAALVSLGLDAT